MSNGFGQKKAEGFKPSAGEVNHKGNHQTLMANDTKNKKGEHYEQLK